VVLSWASKKDVPELVNIDKIANSHDSGWLLQSAKEFYSVIRESKYLTVIARVDGKAVGYLQSGFRNTKRHMWIENVIVLEEFRNRGIARMMVNKFVSHWKSKIDHIVLITEDRNMGVFRALGFEKEMNYMGYRHSRGKRRE
jgi:ribosomal protein S18 acetylase RimI-like enzyme